MKWHIILWSFFSALYANEQLELIKTYQSGALYRLEKIKVARLHGTYHEMGRQYGALLKESINKNFEALIIKGLLETQEISPKKLAEHAVHLIEAYPARFVQLLQGIADATGRTVEQLALLDHYLELLVLYKHHRAGCSTIIAHAPFSKNEQTLLGRNFDFPYFLRDRHEELAFICYNPIDGSNPVGIFGFAGQISSYIFGCNPFFHCGINDASISAGRQVVSERIPMNTQILQLLFNTQSVCAAERFIASIRSPYAFTFFIAGHTDGQMFELPTFGFKRHPQTKDGLYIVTNHHTHPDWGLHLPHIVSDPGYTRHREQNLIHMLAAYDKTLDLTALKEIYDVRMCKDSIDNGVTQYECIKNAMLTLYQFVSAPQEQKVWIKIPLYMDWVCLDLKKLLLNA